MSILVEMLLAFSGNSGAAARKKREKKEEAQYVLQQAQAKREAKKINC